MYDPILPIGFEDIPIAWGEWISAMADWDWFVTITLRDPVRTQDTKAAQHQQMIGPGSKIPLKGPRNSRPGPRMEDVSGTDYTKPGRRHANRAWWSFLVASNRNSPIDDRKWVRVMEYHKFRGVPHIHALITETAGSPRRMDMVDWGWKHYGITRVLQYDPELGAAHYLGKYLLKDEGPGRDMLDIDFGGL